jgi:hypothetical protein
VDLVIRPSQLERRWIRGRAQCYGRGGCRRDLQAGMVLPEVPCLGGCPRWAVRRLCELRLKSWLAAVGRLRRPSLKEEWTYHSFLGYTREIGATLARGRRLAAGVPHFRPDVASR